MKYRAILFTVALIIGLFRPVFIFNDFNRHFDMSYQALAHIVIGILLTLWVCNSDRAAKYAFWILSIVEVVCAITKVIVP